MVGKWDKYLWNIHQQMNFQVEYAILHKSGRVYLTMCKIYFCKILIKKKVQGVFLLIITFLGRWNLKCGISFPRKTDTS